MTSHWLGIMNVLYTQSRVSVNIFALLMNWGWEARFSRMQHRDVCDKFVKFIYDEMILKNSIKTAYFPSLCL